MIPQGKFDFKNVAKNISSDSMPKKHGEKCQHFWINKHFVVKRNGNGDAEKTIHQKCVKCNEERIEHKKYNDSRVLYTGSEK
jgi:hypothetical protein